VGAVKDSTLRRRRAPSLPKIGVPDSRGGDERHPDQLTSREVDVLKLVTAGLTNREMAGRLGLSSRTIDAHLRSIYSKLGVASRSGATRSALERGLV
jgi:DNA-binding NarL/FixJ family response regulator